MKDTVLYGVMVQQISNETYSSEVTRTIAEGDLKRRGPLVFVFPIWKNGTTPSEERTTPASLDTRKAAQF